MSIFGNIWFGFNKEHKEQHQVHDTNIETREITIESNEDLLKKTRVVRILDVIIGYIDYREGQWVWIAKATHVYVTPFLGVLDSDQLEFIANKLRELNNK